MSVCTLTQTLIFYFAETSSGRAKPGQFRIPHSLALIPDFGQLCVADRENGRIQCFRLETGEFIREIKHRSFGRELFAVSYVPGNLFSCSPDFKGLLYASVSQYSVTSYRVHHVILGQIFILFQSRADVMENLRTIPFSYF